MARLTRAESRELNRARILTAACEEFTERGFREAKVDEIAERAGLTRGAVYSNFPGKRALYFAVLADLVSRVPEPPSPPPGGTVREALGTFARVWLSPPLPAGDRWPDTPLGAAQFGTDPLGTAPTGAGSLGASPLGMDPLGAAQIGAGSLGVGPTGTDSPGAAPLRMNSLGTDPLGADLMPQILAEESTRRSFAQLAEVEAILLGLGLEGVRGPVTPGWRLVRLAGIVLTALRGASQMADLAPGLVETYDMVSACEKLADLDLNDGWSPPAAYPAVRPADMPWAPPPALEAMLGTSVDLGADGVVVLLGLHRLATLEDVVRAAAPGTAVTAVVVTGDPDELDPLVRLTLRGLGNRMRHVVPPSAWPGVRIVCDAAGLVAGAAGLSRADDTTESAVRVVAGRIVARADGAGAGHALAAADGEALVRAARRG